MPFDSMFRLRAPCSNCPFRKAGAISLAPGRLRGIVHALLEDDWSGFHCHKTVHHAKSGGQWDDEGAYHPSGREAMCAGAAIFLEKAGRPNVAMRLAHSLGHYEPAQYAAAFDEVIDPSPALLPGAGRHTVRE